ncbi:hypothetical protein GXW78_20190 [Roseomonas terrae]|uniref:Uncharacterized protein n=1 Tax=Neoroseomonas terrae TaxID=424799 RepID=A0ABS5ELT8_9PROT|nr:hypothetical protein [Neoroseomonas terrae]MBR0651996.1 hypothetical protein [Neoroseomonas terrae]
MSAVANRYPAPARAIEGVPVPAASQWLRDAMRYIADPHPNVGFEPERIAPGVREEAGRALIAIDRVLRPATEDDWRAFVAPLRSLPQAPTTAASLALAISGFTFAMNDVPAAALTIDRSREASRSLRFWPSPAELDSILRPATDALKRERRLLDAVAKAPTATTRAAPTEAERAHITAGFASLQAELRARAAEKPRTEAKPSHLNHNQLRAAYAGIDTDAARTRLAALEGRSE